jgi:hypothetical protein
MRGSRSEFPTIRAPLSQVADHVTRRGEQLPLMIVWAGHQIVGGRECLPTASAEPSILRTRAPFQPSPDHATECSRRSTVDYGSGAA